VTIRSLELGDVSSADANPLERLASHWHLLLDSTESISGYPADAGDGDHEVHGSLPIDEQWFFVRQFGQLHKQR